MNETSPVSALALFRIMYALLALVVNEEVPATVSVPMSEMFPVVAVAARLPPTEAFRSSKDLSFTTVALPDPLVVR